MHTLIFLHGDLLQAMPSSTKTQDVVLSKTAGGLNISIDMSKISMGIFQTVEEEMPTVMYKRQVSQAYFTSKMLPN